VGIFNQAVMTRWVDNDPLQPASGQAQVKTINLRGNDNISCDDLNALAAALANTAISIDFGCIDDGSTIP
jgi:hypothetical protein